ncbi:MAG TPA: hypothetical protein VJ302_25880 [Blastocatellia bacterium]|nr:hypothetical protein [Blastocatellia bacterium]
MLVSKFTPKNRLGMVLCFAGAGILMATLQFGLRLKDSTEPERKESVPERPAPLHLERGALQAFLRAYDDLLQNEHIPSTHKEITNYSVDIVQEPMYYKVKFKTAPLPEDKTKDGIAIEYDYWISRATGRMARSK